MLIDKNHPDAKKIKIYDVMGTQVKGAVSYDTDTQMITLALYAGQGKWFVVEQDDGEREILRITIPLPGSYATLEGKKIEK